MSRPYIDHRTTFHPLHEIYQTSLRDNGDTGELIRLNISLSTHYHAKTIVVHPWEHALALSDNIPTIPTPLHGGLLYTRVTYMGAHESVA